MHKKSQCTGCSVEWYERAECKLPADLITNDTANGSTNYTIDQFTCGTISSCCWDDTYINVPKCFSGKS